MSEPRESLPSVTVRVPPSGTVRLPERYAHRFASVPSSWREVTGIRHEWFAFPVVRPEEDVK